MPPSARSRQSEGLVPSIPSPPHHRSPNPMADLTIFYVADIHGSDVCFRKWLNAAAFYGADVLIIGGDFTGKVLLPIYPATGNGVGWTATWKNREHRLET